MDESKQQQTQLVNKSKRMRADVKTIVKNYLQKRNYSMLFLVDSSPEQHVTNCLVESSASRPNSILYSCCNSDPGVFEQNFNKVITWLRDSSQNCNDYQDLEYVIAPLFCHLYLDIIKSGHGDAATAFFKQHIASIDRTKCDDLLKDLLNCLSGENNSEEVANLTNQFRQNKYHIDLSTKSLQTFKKFIAQHCHVVILHILQTYFDVWEIDENAAVAEEEEKEAPHVEEAIECDEKPVQVKQEMNGDSENNDVPDLQELERVIRELAESSHQIYSVHISNTRELVHCALIKRCYGLLAYNQYNILHIRAIHSMDPIVKFPDCKEIKLITHSDQIHGIAIGNRNVVTVSADKTVSIYNILDMCLIKNCQGHLGPVYCVEISSNDCYFATGSQDTTARLWDIEKGATLRVFAGHTSAVTCVDFHPNCLYVVSGSADKTLRMWSIDTGNTLRLFCGSSGVIYTVKFSPKGDVLASAGDENKVKLWDISASKISREIDQESETVTKVVWSQDGTQLCAGTIEGAVKIWNNPLDNPELVLNTTISGKLMCLEYCTNNFACVDA